MYATLCETWAGSYVVWSSSIAAEVVGDILRIIFHYVDDDNYDCVEFEFGGDAGSAGIQPGYVRFIERSGGSESLVGDEMPRGSLIASFGPAVDIFCRRDGDDVNVLVQLTGCVSAERVFTYADVSKVALASGDANVGAITVRSLKTEKYSIDLPEPDENCVQVPGCCIHEGASALEEFDEFGTADWTYDAGIHATSGEGLLLSLWENWTDNDAVALSVLCTSGSFGFTPTAGVEAGLVFDAVDDENYHALIVYEDSGANIIKIVKVTGGVETVLAKSSDQGGFAGSVFFTVCVREGNISTRGPGALSAVTTLHGGKRAGLWAVAIEDEDYELVFTDFLYRLSNECDADEDPERDCVPCRPCDTDLDDPEGYRGKLPFGFLIEVSGVTDDTCTGGLGCDAFNGSWAATPDQDTGGNGAACGVQLLSEEVFCSGQLSPSVEWTITEDTLTVTLSEGFSSATFTYAITGAELCDLTSLEDAAMTLDSTTAGACDFTGASVSISAIPTL
jgi:hypothetical protein